MMFCVVVSGLVQQEANFSRTGTTNVESGLLQQGGVMNVESGLVQQSANCKRTQASNVESVSEVLKRLATAINYILRSILRVDFSENSASKRTTEYSAYCNFNIFIEECNDETADGCTLGDLLSFFTGSSTIPPQGFNKQCTITFNHGSDRLPTASTCSLEIRLPTCHGEDYGSFKDAMVLALKCHDGSTTYPYTRDLMRLQSCTSLPPSHVELFEGGRTPLILAAWEAALARHPDRDFAAYICSGIRFGFRIGFVRGRSLKSASANMFSSFQHPDIFKSISRRNWIWAGRLDPWTQPATPLSTLTDSVLFPKVTILSSVPSTTPRWTTVATVAVELGQGALMTKVDIEAAYRLVPVHPHDRPLLGMEWKGQIFADPMLPFGLRSAPKIFNAIADALEWYLKSRGIAHVFHYLDDFAIVGSPSSDECMRALSVMRQACVELGIPLAEHKTEGPATRITFLGIMIDTTAGQLSLPPEKLARVQSLLTDWGDRKSCSKKELESLIGPTSEFASDASGSWGCGAHTTDSWFQIRWDEQSLPFSITIKELLPIMANDLADDLSRNNLSSFLSKVPALKGSQVKIPTQLLEILVDTSGDWTSQTWTRRFRDTFAMASPRPHTDPTTVH
eukprot:Em0008g503a